MYATPAEITAKALDLIIEVYNNPEEDNGECNVEKHFEDGWHNTGIPFIDDIDYKVYDNSRLNGIKVIKLSTGDTIFELKERKALNLEALDGFLKGYLGIKPSL